MTSKRHIGHALQVIASISISATAFVAVSKTVTARETAEKQLIFRIAGQPQSGFRELENEIVTAVATAMGERAQVIGLDSPSAGATQLLDAKCDVLMETAASGAHGLSTQPYLYLAVGKARVMTVRSENTRLLARLHLAIEKARPAIKSAVTQAGLDDVARSPDTQSSDLTAIQGAEFE